MRSILTCAFLHRLGELPIADLEANGPYSQQTFSAHGAKKERVLAGSTCLLRLANVRDYIASRSGSFCIEPVQRQVLE